MAMTTASAITPAAFAAALKQTGVGDMRPKIAVAVSGGGDSLALALLLHDWVKERKGELLTLTVDHQLRAESAAEAEKVQALLRAQGMTHEILAWQGEKPATGIQELARDARYNLLLSECRNRGFAFLAVAHNLEDQIETFWMRLAHGSGLDGLAGMAASRETEGVTIIRPVLGFSRAQLRATCTHYGVAWIEDPSNKNEKYLRVKLRDFENVLAGEGLTPSRLATTMQKLEDARDALQVMTAQSLATSVQLHPEGYATLNAPAWKKFPREIQRRVLMQTLMAISPQDYPVGFDAIEAARLELQNPAFAGKTLAGCELFPAQGGYIVCVREAAIVEGPVAAVEGKIWDNRFVVSGVAGNDTLKIGALKIGALGAEPLKETPKTLPFKIRRVLPALWLNDNLCAVPHLHYYSADCPPTLKKSRIIFRNSNTAAKAGAV